MIGILAVKWPNQEPEARAWKIYLLEPEVQKNDTLKSEPGENYFLELETILELYYFLAPAPT